MAQSDRERIERPPHSPYAGANEVENYLEPTLPPEDEEENDRQPVKQPVRGRTLRQQGRGRGVRPKANNDNQSPKRRRRGTLPEVGEMGERARATIVTWMIIAFLFPFWWMVVILWGFSLTGLAAETVPILKYVLPGETVFTIFVMFAGFMNLMLSLGAYITYKAAGIDCDSGVKQILFVICVTLGFIPIAQVIPFFYLWCSYVGFFANRRPKRA